MACDHNGFHSGQGRYDSVSSRLRYVMVCDECGQELDEVHTEEYRPTYDPRGNDGYSEAA